MMNGSSLLKILTPNLPNSRDVNDVSTTNS